MGRPRPLQMPAETALLVFIMHRRSPAGFRGYVGVLRIAAVEPALGAIHFGLSCMRERLR